MILLFLQGQAIRTGTVTKLLLERGDAVRVVQRTRTADLPSHAAYTACDILERDAVQRAVEGAGQVVLAVGFPHHSRVWRTAKPKAMANIVEACAAAGSRHRLPDRLEARKDGPHRLGSAVSGRSILQARRLAEEASHDRAWRDAVDPDSTRPEFDGIRAR